MALTDIKIRSAKPTVRVFADGAKKLVTRKLSDGGGLQLWCEPDGGRRWRLAYRFGGKQKTLALGVYPTMSLKDAKSARDDAKRLLRDGVDPGARRKAEKANLAAANGSTFGVICKEVIDKKRREGKTEGTLQTLGILEQMAGPLSDRSIAEITAPEVLTLLRTVEARGVYSMAQRLRAFIGEVFRYAVATGRADSDPTGALRGALTTRKTTHRAAITDPAEFGELLRAVDRYDGFHGTRSAMQLLALTAARPGELRAMRWNEVDFDAAIFTIPAERMKMRRPHRVPLSTQALAILRERRGLIEDDDGFVFPSKRRGDNCLSENTMRQAIRAMGFSKDEMTAHGFRSSFSSMANESGLWSGDVIEKALAHVESNNVRRAYKRNDHWPERVRLAQWWGDECDRMRASAPSAKAA